MRTLSRWVIVGLVLALVGAPLAAQSGVDAPTTNQQVDEAIAKACASIKSVQKEDGSWADFYWSNDPYLGATTSLAVQALLLAGEPYDSPCIQKAVIALTKYPVDRTYCTACRAMAYALLVPHYPELKARLGADAAWLWNNQRPNGMWGYKAGSLKGDTPDNSNTQFAVIGLRDASVAGIEVPDNVWFKLLKHYTSTQLSDGGWSYRPPELTRVEKPREPLPPGALPLAPPAPVAI